MNLKFKGTRAWPSNASSTVPRRQLSVSKCVAKTRHVLSNVPVSWLIVFIIVRVKKSVPTVVLAVRVTSASANPATKCLAWSNVRNGTFFQ